MAFWDIDSSWGWGKGESIASGGGGHRFCYNDLSYNKKNHTNSITKGGRGQKSKNCVTLYLNGPLEGFSEVFYSNFAAPSNVPSNN